MGGSRSSPPPPAQALNQMIKHKPPVKKIGKIGGGIQQIPPPPPPPARALNQMIERKPPVRRIGGGIQRIPPPPGERMGSIDARQRPGKNDEVVIQEIRGGSINARQQGPPQEQIIGQRTVSLDNVKPSQRIEQGIERAPPTPAEREVTFVQPTEVLVKLRETCKILEKHDNTDKPKKEGYQIYNSDEIVGFNLK